VDRARAGEGVQLLEFMTYRRKGHAEHDNQSYVPEGEIEKWAAENDPIDRYVRVLLDREKVAQSTLDEIDARIHKEVDEATDIAEASGFPQPLDAMIGVYADPPAEKPLWFREGADVSNLGKERAEGWGTWDPSKGGKA
jgi:pyruvate dehydrogenase E1 component alpha subunit/2-oxoisovalerate dehydrogenase E1 component alpha subunit